MEAEVKSALIGAGSAIIVAVITTVSGYFITTRTQEAQPEPIIIREPFVVTQKETIREYFRDDIRIDLESAGTTRSDGSGVESSAAISDQGEAELAVDILIRKRIGIYYSLGDSAARQKASMLTAHMNAKELDATFYSIGRFYSSPNTPSHTHIYGLDETIDETAFKESFKRAFDYTSKLRIADSDLDTQPVIDDQRWRIDMDVEKDIYIVIGQ